MLDFYKLSAELGHVSIPYAHVKSSAGKVHLVTRPLNEKASFLVISDPGNWPFLQVCSKVRRLISPTSGFSIGRFIRVQMENPRMPGGDLDNRAVLDQLHALSPP